MKYLLIVLILIHTSHQLTIKCIKSDNTIDEFIEHESSLDVDSNLNQIIHFMCDHICNKIQIMPIANGPNKNFMVELSKNKTDSTVINFNSRSQLYSINNIKKFGLNIDYDVDNAFLLLNVLLSNVIATSNAITCKCFDNKYCLCTYNAKYFCGLHDYLF